MGNKNNFFQAINEITKDPSFSIDNITKTSQLPMNQIQGFYSNLTESVNSLNKILSPYIIDTYKAFTDTAKVYMETVSAQYQYRKSIYDMWNNLEEELKTKNRYFPKNELLNILENLTKEAKCYLKKGTILYRARKISEREFPNEVHRLFDYIMEKNNYQWNSKKLISVCL